MATTILHKADTRGHANHGWLNAYHSFSFASYRDNDRVHFGALRVLNDDTVQPGMGFGTHPHDNMEIVTIPLNGDLEHKDSMGNIGVIKQNDIQAMSAGSSITHSEYNHNKDKVLSLLQIWVFPKLHNIKPRYDQRTFKKEDRINQLQQVVSPDGNPVGMNINQDAFFMLGSLTKDFTTDYKIQIPGNGVYAFVIEGSVTIDNVTLDKRDALGISDTSEINIKANADTELLLIEVPMVF